jgi:ketosteroid isomerase-like protein
MSEETVRVVQDSFDAWNAGDMEAYGELLSPDVVVRMPSDWPEPGPFVGREAALRAYLQGREAFSADVADRITDYVEIGNQVVARFAWRGRGRGPAMDMEISCLYTVRKGQLVGMDFFWDHADALEAAGLAE